jgi:hypothetical protein
MKLFSATLSVIFLDQWNLLELNVFAEWRLGFPENSETRLESFDKTIISKNILTKIRKIKMMIGWASCNLLGAG